jgi:cytosine/adenosine deaminase-related metal-dependent hydrolase
MLRGKHVITRVDDTSSDVITDGAVYQEDGVIVAVGRHDDLRSTYSPDEVIGDGTHVVLPGLINDHHHTGITPFQLGHPDLPLEMWVAIRRASRFVDPYLDTLYGAIDMIEHGVTTVLHMWAASVVPPGGTPADVVDQVLGAYQEIGMRVAFGYLAADQNLLFGIYQDAETFLTTLPPELAASLRSSPQRSRLDADEYASLIEDLAFRHRADDLVDIHVSPINVQWSTDELLTRMKDVAVRLGTGLHIHLQETAYQREFGIRTWGKSPLAHLDDLGFLGPDITCGHGVWLSEADLDILAATGCHVCHNPSSNLRTKSGIAPLNKLLARGIPVALGIDEAGINDDRDMFQEMRLALKLHRIPGVDNPAPTSHDVLRMATRNGAEALGIADRVGVLEPGKQADVILVDTGNMRRPFLDPGVDVVDALLHRARGVDVDTVVVAGVPLLRGRKFTRVDKEQVLDELGAQLAAELTPDEIERRAVAAAFVTVVRDFYRGWDVSAAVPHHVYSGYER